MKGCDVPVSSRTSTNKVHVVIVSVVSALVFALAGCGNVAADGKTPLTKDGVPVTQVCDLETGMVTTVPADEIDTTRQSRDLQDCEKPPTPEVESSTAPPSAESAIPTPTQTTEQPNPYEDAPLDGGIPPLPKKNAIEVARKAFGFEMADHEMTVRLELPIVFCRWVEEGGEQIPMNVMRMHEYALAIYEDLYPSLPKGEVSGALEQDIMGAGCGEEFLAIGATGDDVRRM